jgi:hypothetical protein
MRISFGLACLLLLGTVLVVAAAVPQTSESSLEADAIAAEIIQEEAGMSSIVIYWLMMCVERCIRTKA